MSAIPLSVLDLVPISSGSTASEALANTVDLARCAEAAGYERYWMAEHHLNPGVAGTSPAVVMSLIAGATQRLRIGSGAVQTGHRTALSIVEEFGLLDAAFPGRVDLGLGRSGARRPPGGTGVSGNGGPGVAVRDPDERELLAVGADGQRRTVGGPVIPEPFSFGALLPRRWRPPPRGRSPLRCGPSSRGSRRRSAPPDPGPPRGRPASAAPNGRCR